MWREFPHQTARVGVFGIAQHTPHCWQHQSPGRSSVTFTAVDGPVGNRTVVYLRGLKYKRTRKMKTTEPSSWGCEGRCAGFVVPGGQFGCGGGCRGDEELCRAPRTASPTRGTGRKDVLRTRRTTPVVRVLKSWKEGSAMSMRVRRVCRVVGDGATHSAWVACRSPRQAPRLLSRAWQNPSPPLPGRKDHQCVYHLTRFGAERQRANMVTSVSAVAVPPTGQCVVPSVRL